MASREEQLEFTIREIAREVGLCMQKVLKLTTDALGEEDMQQEQQAAAAMPGNPELDALRDEVVKGARERTKLHTDLMNRLANSYFGETVAPSASKRRASHERNRSK